ncbi:hypothetical protein SAMN05428939_8130 [Streptomyces sp. TLI_105]|nr:hypothetical protein SAMN05428939_8130 [Streptomyces sp. TLI_105]
MSGRQSTSTSRGPSCRPSGRPPGPRLAPVLGSSSSSWVEQSNAVPGPQGPSSSRSGPPARGLLHNTTEVAPPFRQPRQGLWNTARPARGLSVPPVRFTAREGGPVSGSSSGARSLRRGRIHLPAETSTRRYAGRYREADVLIVPDLVSPEKSSPACFRTFRTFGAFHVTEQALLIFRFATFEQEVTLPAGNHELIVSSGSARPFLGSVHRRSLPAQRDGAKVLARRAGAVDQMRVRRSLSTGRSGHRARVIIARAVAPVLRLTLARGVRFGRYTTAMNICTALPAPSVRSLATFRLPAVGSAR